MYPVPDLIHILNCGSAENRTCKLTISKLLIKLKIKSVAYSSQGSQMGQLDFRNLRKMVVGRDNVISIMLRQVY